MSEITKLYKNAGVKPEINYVCDKEPCGQHSVDCQECSHLYDTREDYPDFTAEKQIELIKEIYPGYPLQYASGNCGDFSFEEGLAYRINNSWEDLMEKQKQQIKEILE